MDDERYTEEALRQLARQLPGKPVTVRFRKDRKVGRVVAAEYLEEEGAVRVTMAVDDERWRGMVGLPD